MITKMVTFDASTKKTGVGIFVNGILTNHTLIDCSQIEDREKRMRQMAKNIIDILNENNPDMVVIEDSWSAANVDITKLLTRIMGVTFGWCVFNDKDWYSLLPSQWRKLCNIDQGLKKRNELKQASIQYVYDRYGIIVGDDEADACAIGAGVLNYFTDKR